MDRRVKERLVGATILLMLVVLVVPEVLRGPKQPPGAGSPAAGSPAAAAPSTAVPAVTSAVQGHTITVDVFPQAATRAPTRSAAAAAAAPAADVPVVASADETRSRAPEQPRAASPPRGELLTPRDSAASWAVQLGSFAEKANADKLVRELQAGGHAVYVVPTVAGSAARYRVRMGPLADRDAAERSVAKFKAQGIPATIVSPTP